MTDMLDFALETARNAGHLLCDFYYQDRTVRFKSSDIDVVTEADLASDRLINAAIEARFPEHVVLSEEGVDDLGEAIGSIPHLWLVDPLDGTVNYTHRYPVWGISLALAERGQVVLGVTYDPVHDEMFWAERGQGAWCGDRQMRVSNVSRLRDALVATGFAYKRATLSDNNLAEFSAVMPRVQGIRRAGAAVLDLAYLADGRLDAYWEMHLNPWDWAAGSLFVKEAGGVSTDLRGEPWSLEKRDIVVSNGRLHGELLALFEEARQARER